MIGNPRSVAPRNATTRNVDVSGRAEVLAGREGSSSSPRRVTFVLRYASRFRFAAGVRVGEEI